MSEAAAPPHTAPPHAPPRRVWPVLVSVVAAAAVGWAGLSTWHDSVAVGADLVAALWTLPLLVLLHLLELLMSAQAWRGMFGGGERPGLAVFYRLRIMREGIDSLLPVAQVGGELVAAARLAARGIRRGRAAASVIVDLTVEVLTQLLFLLAGLAVLGRAAQAGAALWLGLALLAVASGGALLAAQRFGLLRLLEAVLRRIAARFPALVAASAEGLHHEALGFYRRRGALAGAVTLHLTAWVLGTGETWLVLHALGVGASWSQSFAVESLGMAARSAGFAVPGALVVQEGGFMLAAVAAGLPADPALALSLVKRMREVLVGSLGLALWRIGPG